MNLRHQETPELDITAFMNLMVALIPFLLLSAAFSQVAVLQLMMPAAGAAGAGGGNEELQLELVIEADGLALKNGAGKGSVLAQLHKRDGKHDLATLTEELAKIKSRYPQRSDIILRARPDTNYATIIQLMDTVRARQLSEGMVTVEQELFPDIAIADAEMGGAP
ncbi:MAG TPA: biopolymer transporter ExbD [Gammaproteobacteria bacterium]